MDKTKPDTDSISCKNIFKSDVAQIRKQNFTDKMAELISQQQRLWQIHTVKDNYSQTT